MTITLTDHLAVFVRTKVKTGEFASENEVISEGLRLLEQSDAARKRSAAESIAAGLENAMATTKSKARMMKLIRNPVRVPGFTPLSREECNERQP